MLAIRMQRTGRSGHAQFRVIVQDSRFSPKSGRVTAYVGSYNPHDKVAVLDKDKISQYLGTGAQPSESVAQLLKKEGVKLPGWVKFENQKTKRTVRHPEKLRRNRPAGAVAPETPAAESAEDQPAEASAETPAAEEQAPEETASVEETPAETAEAPAEAAPEAPVEEPKEEA